MTTIDYIYRVDPQKPQVRPSPTTSAAARRSLEEGNRRYSQWMEHRCTCDCSQGQPSYVVPCNAIDVGPSSDSLAIVKQAPFAVVVGCSDARVPTEMLFGQGFNELFVIRVAGNILADACMGSIDFALSALADSVRLVVMLGHSGCGAVAGAVDAYISPEKFMAKPMSSSLRGIVQKIMVAVREAATGLDEVWGPQARDDANYRAALLESAVALNAALSAHELRQEVERGGKRDVEVVFGVHNLRTHEVSMPVDPTTPRKDDHVRLATAPAHPNELHSLAIRMAEILRKTAAQKRG